MRFKSPTNTPVTLTVGPDKADVGPTFAELDPKFHAEAKAQGCIAESPEASETARIQNPDNQRQVPDNQQQQASDPNPPRSGPPRPKPRMNK